jgi:hypothetical protein
MLFTSAHQPEPHRHVGNFPLTSGDGDLLEGFTMLKSRNLIDLN